MMPEAEWVFVALGSNVGERDRWLAFARERLDALPQTSVIASSRIDETDALGPIEQGAFLNQMVLLQTTLDARSLLESCLEIERLAGRKRAQRWGPRTLDLDIVRYGEHEIDEPGLVVPHPEIRNREFWVRELEELATHVV